MSDELYFGPVSFIPARSVRDANYRSLPRRTADVWPAPPSGRLSPLRQPHDKRYISTPDGSSVRLIRHSLIGTACTSTNKDEFCLVPLDDKVSVLENSIGVIEDIRDALQVK